MAGRLQGGGRLGDRVDVDAEVMRDRRRGQEVHEEVRAGERQRDILRLGADAKREPHPVHRPAPVLRGDVEGAVAAEPEDAPAPGAVGLADPLHARVVAVEDRHAALGQALQDLGLGRRDVVHRGEELQVHRRHHGDHGHVGPGDAGQRAQLAGRGHPQLQDGGRVLRPEPEQHQREAVLVVEVPLGLEHRSPRAEERGGHLLGGGLSRGAGDAHDRDVGLRPRVAREIGQAARGLGHADQAQARRRLDVAMDERSQGTAGSGLRHEVVAVEARAGDGHEELSRLHPARVDGHAAHPQAGRAGDHLAAGRHRDVLERRRLLQGHDRPQAFPLRSPGRARSARATCRSSKGTVRSRSTW
jgi:hypothetical protein